MSREPLSGIVVGTYEQILIDILTADSFATATNVVRVITQQALARRAADLIDPGVGALSPEWPRLDEPRYRTKIVQWDSTQWQACVERWKPQRTAINEALQTAGKSKLGWEALCKRLFNVTPIVVSRARQVVDRENPFPGLWRLVADELAARLYKRNTPHLLDPEWGYLNVLLLIGFFSSCRLPRARLVWEAMDQVRQKPMGPRGVFVRVPELISNSGVADRAVPLSARSGGVSLAQEGVSVLVAATAEESRKVSIGRGMLHEIMSIHGPSDVPLSMWGAATPIQLARARDAAFRLYEYTIVAYLALASVEQLLRSWAHRMGQGHVKANGQPQGVLEWVQHLGCPNALLEAVRDLYDSDRSNIRNRVMHGNLLEVEAKRMEAYLPVLDDASVSTIGGMNDPFHPQNIARLCLDCLENVDAALTTAGLALCPADLAWTAKFALSSEEIDLGLALPVDFFGKGAERWHQLVFSYLNALCPGLRQVWAIGFVGWLDNPFRPSLPRFMALAFGFEALYRLTVHLLGVEVLQRSRPRCREVLKTQYKMLDARNTGIATDGVLDRIIAHVPVAGQDTARKVLRLAIKARNAVAHGAVTTFDDRTSDGLGHIVVKAGQTLVTAGLHHLIRERAYFRWVSERNKQDGFDRDDWFTAERATHEWLDVVGR